MQKVIVGLGELLWDLLPSGKRLGGAPANFTVMSSRLGNRAVIASRLGNDPLAAEARQVLQAFPADISLLQTDPVHPTGTVGVEIRGNEPHYIIHEPASENTWSGHRNGAHSLSPPMPSASVRSPSATPPSPGDHPRLPVGNPPRLRPRLRRKPPPALLQRGCRRLFAGLRHHLQAERS